jgi:hypothetical protein
MPGLPLSPGRRGDRMEAVVIPKAKKKALAILGALKAEKMYYAVKKEVKR